MSIDKGKTVAALTLGCKVNAYDTEAMTELFAARGYEVVEFGCPADVCIINTCTVTRLGDKKSRQMLRRARKINPNGVVVAAGCYAQVAPEEVLKIPEVDLVVGTKDRGKIVDLVEDHKGRRSIVTDIMTETSFEPLRVRGLNNRTRAYLKIQEGCDKYCSYCIIPYARGHIRSRRPEEVINEVRTLVENGYKEIVLAGIHVASYGKDLGTGDLLTVISSAHELAGLRRIRLSSIDPFAITPEFLESVSRLPKLCPHFHLSLQSGCDKTLRRMNRGYKAEDYRKAVELLRRVIPNVAITTDIIVGFPGETVEDFEISRDFVSSVGLAKIHVFPYSPKEKTPAAGFPEQIPAAVKNARAAEMISLGEGLTRDFLSGWVGRELEVLYETQTTPGVYEGYSENYITVRTESRASLLNQIRKVKIYSHVENYLISHPL